MQRCCGQRPVSEPQGIINVEYMSYVTSAGGNALQVT